MIPCSPKSTLFPYTTLFRSADGVDTGICAADRARTVQAAVARDAKPSDLVQPGHIFPLKAARDRKSTRLNSSHVARSYAVFCLKKKKKNHHQKKKAE